MCLELQKVQKRCFIDHYHCKTMFPNTENFVAPIYSWDWKSQHYISNTGISLYSRFVSSVKSKTTVNKGALYSIKKRSKYRKKTIEYRQPSLFAVFLSANSLIHIEKLLKNADFLVRNGLFICKFSIRGPRWRNLYTANNEASLYTLHNSQCSGDEEGVEEDLL